MNWILSMQNVLNIKTAYDPELFTIFLQTGKAAGDIGGPDSCALGWVFQVGTCHINHVLAGPWSCWARFLDRSNIHTPLPSPTCPPDSSLFLGFLLCDESLWSSVAHPPWSLRPQPFSSSWPGLPRLCSWTLLLPSLRKYHAVWG